VLSPSSPADSGGGIRALALHEADGDPWEALRRLVDPAWHHDRAAALTDAIQEVVA
jgi:cytochrome P450